MKLIEEWRVVLQYAWSVRIMVLCIIMQLLEQPIVDFIQQHFTGYSWWVREGTAVLIASVGILAIYARVKFQQKLQDKLAEAVVKREDAPDANQQQ